MKQSKISGSRIKQARELRGLSQRELADRIGVSQPAVAKYEKDFAQPTDESLRGIALQTGFPPSFFRLPSDQGVPLGTHLLLRARASRTNQDLVKAHRLAEMIHEAIENLAMDVTVIKPKIPRLNETPSHAARLTRSQMSITPDKPIQNLVRAVERAGVRVIGLPLDVHRIDAFSLWTGENADTPVIGIMRGRTGDRVRWSVAHELGHLVLHQSFQGEPKQAEREAELFAAEFLMPEDAIRQEMEPAIGLMDIAKLKPRWRVSMQALIRRAHDLDLITRGQYNYLFMQLSQNGWRMREPENLDVPQERPRLLKKMAEVAYKNPIPYSKIASRLCWTEQFVKEVLGEHADKNDSFKGAVSAKASVLTFKPQRD